MSSGCDTEGYCILRNERTLTVLSDFHTDVIVMADDIKGKGHLAEASSVPECYKEPCCFSVIN